MGTTKICQSCGRERPLEEFERWAARDGRARCEECKRIARNESMRRYRATPRGRERLRAAQQSYVDRKRPRCPVCGRRRPAEETP